MTFVECPAFSMCPEMVVIPEGEFEMGSTTNGSRPEEGTEPVHHVRIAQRFAVSKYEVTFDQWDTCVQHGWCSPAKDSGYGRGQRPVINVSWKDAREYVRWLSYMTGQQYRMLSEAEWEYAARGGTTTPYYWDNDQYVGGNFHIDKGHANCAECNNGPNIDNLVTLPVGQFPPNPFGLCDTRGNVWEFTADAAHDNYEGAPADGSPWAGPDNNGRVLRGGSWSSIAKNLTASYRFIIPSDDDTYPGGGLRVARTLVDAKPTDVKSTTARGMSGRQNTCQIMQPN